MQEGGEEEKTLSIDPCCSSQGGGGGGGGGGDSRNSVLPAGSKTPLAAGYGIQQCFAIYTSWSCRHQSNFSETEYISVTLISVNSTLSRSFLPRGWGKTGG